VIPVTLTAEPDIASTPPLLTDKESRIVNVTLGKVLDTRSVFVELSGDEILRVFTVNVFEKLPEVTELIVTAFANELVMKTDCEFVGATPSDQLVTVSHLPLADVIQELV
jgi:hypothetical protein